MDAVRDRLWLWGHPAGSHTKRDPQWGVPGRSSIEPVEAARYMGIPNVVMVRYELEPEPPFEEYARPFAELDRVVWSIEGAGGDDVEAALELREVLPNLEGIIMDDYFGRVAEGHDEGAFSLGALQALKPKLAGVKPPLDLWVVLYMHELAMGERLRPHLELCDVVTLWTWRAAELADLETNMAACDEITAGRRRVLGLYMWDYGTGNPMPLDAMGRQCEVALKWLHEGRIEGMIFLASCICDLGLETVEWTRRWIAEHGDELVGDA